MTTSPMASIVGSAVAVCIICAMGLYANLNEHKRRQEEEMCANRGSNHTSRRPAPRMISGKRLNADKNSAQRDTKAVNLDQTQNNNTNNNSNCIISNTADYLTGLATMAMLDEKVYFPTAFLLSLIFCTILLCRKETGTTKPDPNVNTYMVRCLILMLLWSYRFGADFASTQGN